MSTIYLGIAQNAGNARQKLAEARVSRTHRCPERATAGFEDREDHRIPKRSLIARPMKQLAAALNAAHLCAGRTTIAC